MDVISSSLASLRIWECINSAPDTTSQTRVGFSNHLADEPRAVSASIAQNTFVDRGTALAEINQNELYEPVFSSFEDYCVKRSGFKRAHGYLRRNRRKCMSSCCV